MSSKSNPLGSLRSNLSEDSINVVVFLLKYSYSIYLMINNSSDSLPTCLAYYSHYTPSLALTDHLQCKVWPHDMSQVNVTSVTCVTCTTSHVLDNYQRPL